MSYFDRVQHYYAAGLWSKDRVADAVIHSWITREQYKEITGEDY